MKKTILGIVAACLIAVPGAFAKTSNWSAHANANSSNISTRVQDRVNLLSTALSLNDSQKQQATTIFTNAANETKAIFASLNSERKDLTAAERNNAAANQIKQISNQIGNEAGQLVANMATAQQKFYQTLTPQQQTKLTQLQGELHREIGVTMGRIVAEGM
ncbi:MAG TPA: Spy/CpxP family protein refolding chaperone [Candidatus Aquilonibacter sp.]|nr:Spy/CpxP family protein refolding chaperone [Candidatus Aquilonibacter sp.]